MTPFDFVLFIGGFAIGWYGTALIYNWWKARR